MRRDRNQLRNVILAGVCTPSINGVTGVLSEAGFIAAFAVKSIRISFADDDEILLAMDYGQEKIEGHWVVSLDRIAYTWWADVRGLLGRWMLSTWEESKYGLLSPRRPPD